MILASALQFISFITICVMSKALIKSPLSSIACKHVKNAFIPTWIKNNQKKGNVSSFKLFSTDTNIPSTPTPEMYENNKTKKQTRFRQHVNPLSRKFQVPVDLPEKWVEEAYDDPSLPLYLDIGCGKGGFLLDLATSKKNSNAVDKMNYLGLEIRPGVAEYAMQRVASPTWNLSGQVYFIGCNANVDLERILHQYKSSCKNAKLNMASIQFPDPHFKTQHKKRRVVTSELVQTLAKYMEVDTTVFLQSDIKDVLDNMRERFRDYPEYFVDQVNDVDKYLETNPLGVPTEREISVIANDLPIYRALFKRTENRIEMYNNAID